MIPIDMNGKISLPPLRPVALGKGQVVQLPSLASVLNGLISRSPTGGARNTTQTEDPITPPASSPLKWDHENVSSGLDMLVEASLLQTIMSSPSENLTLLLPYSSSQSSFPSPSRLLSSPFLIPLPEKSHRFRVRLQSDSLWQEFNSLPNEMIITKNGRCLFPVLKLELFLLDVNETSRVSPHFSVDPDRFYAFAMDIIPLSSNRLRFKAGSWEDIGSLQRDPELLLQKLSKNADIILSKVIDHDDDDYNDDFRMGGYCMYLLEPGIFKGSELVERRYIQFNRAKLTNSFSSLDFKNNNIEWLYHSIDKNDYGLAKFLRQRMVGCPIPFFLLQSFHAYQPRFHFIEVGKEETSRIRSDSLVSSLIYPQTQFIGVTHYQNQRVNTLKKQWNPHAKGFRDISFSNPGEEEELSDVCTAEEYGNGGAMACKNLVPYIHHSTFLETLKTGVAAFLTREDCARARRDSGDSNSSSGGLAVKRKRTYGEI